MEDPAKAIAGADICKQFGLMSGSLYPILNRLERAGWLKSKWEHANPSNLGRPRRRLYRPTPLGLLKGRKAFDDLGVLIGEKAWSY